MSDPYWTTVSPRGVWFQAACTCGYQGTVRMQARTADDDAANHASKNAHLWAVS